FGGQGARPPANPQTDRITVVADPATNTLLVRASALDLITIKGLLEKAIDSGETDSTAVIKTWFLPLKYASASEVALPLRAVYREHMNDSPQSATVGGFNGFAFRGFGGGGFGGGGFNRRNVDANGNPKQVTLSVGVDERSNNLILSCSEAMKKDIEKVVEY